MGLLPVSHIGKWPDPCKASLGPWVGGVVSPAELPITPANLSPKAPTTYRKAACSGAETVTAPCWSVSQASQLASC